MRAASQILVAAVLFSGQLVVAEDLVRNLNELNMTDRFVVDSYRAYREVRPRPSLVVIDFIDRPSAH